jgi:hypothetical protein
MGVWLLTLLLAAAIANDAALAQTHKPKPRQPSCFSAGPLLSSSVPIAETKALDPAITGTFAVLRRAAAPEDQPPLFNPLNEDLGYQLRSYLPAYLRQLASDPDGERYFLIVGFERGFPLPPAQCLPKEVRRHVAQLIAEQRKRENQPVYCVDDIGPHRTQYGASCQPFASIQTGAGLIASAQSTSDVIELVPDGVATVRLLYRRGTTITSSVANNEFDFTPPQGPIKEARARVRRLFLTLRRDRLAHRKGSRDVRSLLKRLRDIDRQLPPDKVEWLGANGQLIRSFQPRIESGGTGVGRSLIIS